MECLVVTEIEESTGIPLLKSSYVLLANYFSKAPFIGFRQILEHRLCKFCTDPVCRIGQLFYVVFRNGAFVCLQPCLKVFDRDV